MPPAPSFQIVTRRMPLASGTHGSRDNRSNGGNAERAREIPVPTSKTYGAAGAERGVIVYRVEYFCPRQNPARWQVLKGFLGIPKSFSDLNEATNAANQLLWQYHSARVVNQWGGVEYQI